MQSHGQVLSVFNKIPDEIILIILKYLVIKDLLAFSLTSTRMLNLVNDDSLWMHHVMRQLPRKYKQLERMGKNAKGCYKAAFFSEFTIYFDRPVKPNVRRLFYEAMYADKFTQSILFTMTLADLLVRDMYGVNVLGYARNRKNQALLDAIFKHVANIYKKKYIMCDGISSIVGPSTLSEVVDDNENTLITWAVLCGQISWLESLLDDIKLKELAFKINDANMFGDTPLHVACTINSLNAIRILLQLGADPHQLNYKNQTPFQIIAAFYNLVDLISLYDKNFIPWHYINKPSHYYQFTLLHVAAQADNTHNVELILKNGEDVNIKTSVHLDEHNNPILGFFAARSQYPLYTPLHFAAQSGSLETVKLLLAYNADISALSARHETPLDVALESGQSVVARYLYLRGASIYQEHDHPTYHAIVHIYNGMKALKNYVNEVDSDKPTLSLPNQYYTQFASCFRQAEEADAEIFYSWTMKIYMTMDNAKYELLYDIFGEKLIPCLLSHWLEDGASPIKINICLLLIHASLDILKNKMHTEGSYERLHEYLTLAREYSPIHFDTGLYYELKNQQLNDDCLATLSSIIGVMEETYEARNNTISFKP